LRLPGPSRAVPPPPMGRFLGAQACCIAVVGMTVLTRPVSRSYAWPEPLIRGDSWGADRNCSTSTCTFFSGSSTGTVARSSSSIPVRSAYPSGAPVGRQRRTGRGRSRQRGCARASAGSASRRCRFVRRELTWSARPCAARRGRRLSSRKLIAQLVNRTSADCYVRGGKLLVKSATLKGVTRRRPSWKWVPPSGWPTPPQDWTPSATWEPPGDWPRPSPHHQWWRPTRSGRIRVIGLVVGVPLVTVAILAPAFQ
jgi:hypothetical protein